jgi:hypothetical protein
MKRCFVISPIGEEGSEIRDHANDVFDYIIKPAMEECNILPIRSDQLLEPGKITDQMIREILNDDLCIAVLTFYNPNVFYELAIAQSFERPVVILIEKGQSLPFDVRDFRCVKYDFKPKSIVEKIHAKEIVDHLKKIEANGWKAKGISDDLRQLSFKNFSLFLVSPSELEDFDITQVKWKEDECFLISTRIEEKITLLPSGIGQAFKIVLSDDLLQKVLEEEYIELHLKDKKGNRWVVNRINPFEINIPVSLGENIDKIIGDYGGDQ